MKKTLKTLEAFETQTEQELREVMGGSFLSDCINKIGGVMLMYGVRPEKGLVAAKYGVLPKDDLVVALYGVCPDVKEI